ncbi:MAG: hypothetical protein C4331_05875 [Meiothermus sp.]
MEELRTTLTDAPPGLERGLYLENHRLLLPWYTPHRAARMLLGLEDGRPDKDTLTWNEMACLGGLECSIAGKFVVDETVDPEKHCLRLVEFPGPDEPTEAVYARVKAHLVGRLGETTLEYDGSESRLKAFAEWDGDEVMWKVVGGDKDECVGELWRKPFPKEYLKLTLTSF